MKNRKLVATLLSLTMMAGLGVNSLAASNPGEGTIKVSGKVNELKISVTWPKPTLVINPYGMKYKTGKDSSGADVYSQDQIISTGSYLINKTGAALTMTGTYTATAKTTDLFGATTGEGENAVTNSTGFGLVAADSDDLEGTGKVMALQLNYKSNGTKTAEQAKTAKVPTAEEMSDGTAVDILLTEGEATNPLESLEIPAADTTSKSNAYVSFWFTGEANGGSTNMWTKNDTVDLVIKPKLSISGSGSAQEEESVVTIPAKADATGGTNADSDPIYSLFEGADADTSFTLSSVKINGEAKTVGTDVKIQSNNKLRLLAAANPESGGTYVITGELSYGEVTGAKFTWTVTASDES